MDQLTSPTYLAISARRAWSDAHVFEPHDLHRSCGRCGQPEGHHDHISRVEDKLETMRWRDRVAQ